MKKIYKTLLLGIALSVASLQVNAQLAGTYSVPATFTSLAAAINSLNVAGVNGTVTIAVAAGYTEAVPFGGYTLTATGTATSPIIFQKFGAGNNPRLIAYGGGSGTAINAVQDGVWRFIGSDYITIDGIDIQDPNVANPANMEFGYGFFKANAANGCQFNTIKNCTITLNKDNNSVGLTPAAEGSRGIDFVNALTNSHTSPVTVTATTGAHSNNTIIRNLIQNVNIGVNMTGYMDAFPYSLADFNNVIGGAANSNTIVNFGGGVGGTNPSMGINTMYQYDANISYNLLNSNNGSGMPHLGFLRGIHTGTANAANVTITNNTISLHGGSNGWALIPIHNYVGATGTTNTVNISNNLITGSTYTSALNVNCYGIWNASGAGLIAVNNNTFSNNQSHQTAGQFYCIANSGVGNEMQFNNNLMNLGTINGANSSALIMGLSNQAGGFSSTLSVIGNTIQNITYSTTGTGTHYYIYNTTLQGLATYSGNIWNNINNTSTGTCYMFYDGGGAATKLVADNSIVGSFNKAGTGTFYGLYNAGGTTGSATITANNLSNINLAQNFCYGIYSFASSQPVTITNNTLSAWTSSYTGTHYAMYFAYANNVSNNIVSNITVPGPFYGMYNTTNTSYSNSISQNTISNITSTASSVYGIYAVSSLSTNVSRNKVVDLQSNATFGSAFGIYYAGGSTYNTFNNIVGHLRAPFSSNANAVNGIYISSGSTHNLYFNSVYLNATSTGSGFGSNAIYASTFPQVTLRNNIFINNSIATGAGLTVAYRRSSTTLTSYNAASNNNIFYAGTPAPNNFIHHNGSLGYTMAGFQALVTPRDNVSNTENTIFTSIVPTNTAYLHINPQAPSFADNGAVSIAGITDDYDADVRTGTPDRGADEYTSAVPVCNLVSPAVITPSAMAMCDAQSTTLAATAFTTGTGITYQWQVATVPGGPYTNVVGLNGENYPLSYQTNTLTPNTYYYVLLTTCTLSGQFAVSNEATVTVSSYPSLTVTPNTSTICSPGGASVALTASGANSYTWAPAAGLNATVGVNVNALPGGSTIYTITGVNGAGCASVTTVSITVLEGPSIVTISATPSVACSGSSSSLQVLGATTNSYVITPITYSPIPTPSVGVTQFCNNGTVTIPPTQFSFSQLDDGIWANLDIPFGFNFYGAGYNKFMINTNGFIQLGSGAPTNGGYGGTFPAPFSANPCIGAVYSDLNFGVAGLGSITTFTTGVAPNRKLVVNWTNGTFYFNTGSVTAQAILYETSNIIEVHTAFSSGINTAIQGIQDLGGVNASVVAGRNGVTWQVNSPDAFRWTPAGGPINYTWTPSTFLTATNIPNPVAQTVTTSVTYTTILEGANGCTNTAVLNLNSDATPTVAVTGPSVACSATGATLTASGASTYSWSNGVNTPTAVVNPTANTVYTVVGTTSLGCTDTKTVAITFANTPTVTISGPSVSCASNQINLVAAGAATYSWSTGSTLSVIAPSPSTTITYSVVGTTTAGCASNSAKTVTVYPAPSVTITVPAKLCVGETASIVASGIGVDTYSWNTGANTAVIAESPTVNTNYTVTVTNTITGCSKTSTATLIVDPCVGLNEINGVVLGLSVYPNPNTGEFVVELNNGKEKTIEIADVTGRIIYSEKTSVSKLNVNISEMANGIYYVKVSSNDASQVYKIVKQ